MLKRNFYIFELDENLNTIYQNVWDIAKEVIREKIIVLKSHIRR